MPRTVVAVSGLRELEAALKELPKATARNTLKRVLMKAGQPIAEAARRNAPVYAGDDPRAHPGQLRDSIIVSAKLKNPVGKAEFAAAMRAGLGKAAATGALRDARRAAAGEGSFAEVYVGPGPLPYAHLVEFGSVHNAPHPYLRPAWDSEKTNALAIIRRDLGEEVAKSARRLAKRRAKAAAAATE